MRLYETSPGFEDRLRMTLDEGCADQVPIKVFGIGGGGCNAVNRMIEAGVRGVHFIAANTDFQSLRLSKAPVKIQLGAKLTAGRGAGADPEVGRKAALEDTDKILEQLEGAEMTFVTAGMGGGTGTGGAPVVGALAKEMGALTIAVVTKPFRFEGVWRLSQAEKGFEELKDSVDSVVAVLNDRLLSAVPPGTSMMDALDLADDFLRQAVQGTTDLINTPGRINLDFAHVKNVLEDSGFALMGTGYSDSEKRAKDAAFEAIHHPLLEEKAIRRAQGVLVNVTGSRDLALEEVTEACGMIQREADSKARIAVGSVRDDSLERAVRITVIAAGCDSGELSNKSRPSPTNGATDKTGTEERYFENESHVAPEDLEIPAYLRFPPDDSDQR
jgi:cell division protein FtsZ